MYGHTIGIEGTCMDTYGSIFGKRYLLAYFNIDNTFVFNSVREVSSKFDYK